MTAGRADFLRKYLAKAGLSSDSIAKYIDVLKMFLAAKCTKIRFEDEMAKVIPQDKYHVHNSIIREILHRAQAKREGQPELPIIAPSKDRRLTQLKSDKPHPRTPRFTPPANSNVTALPKPDPSSAGGIPKHLIGKRKREDIEHDPKAVGASDALSQGPPRTKQKIGLSKIPTEKPETDSKLSRTKLKIDILDKQSPKRAKWSGDVSALEGSGGVAGAVNGMANGTRSGGFRNAGVAVPVVDIPSYDDLSFFPTHPGQAMDLDLFLKLRPRMRRICMGVAVKDDAVALLLHGLEIHVKNMLEASVRHRIARESTRPCNYSQCDPVTAYDVREAVLQTKGLLGEGGEGELERLSMLL